MPPQVEVTQTGSETINQLVAAANKLHAINPKTLAQHEEEQGLVRYIEFLEGETK